MRTDGRTVVSYCYPSTIQDLSMAGAVAAMVEVAAMAGVASRWYLRREWTHGGTAVEA